MTQERLRKLILALTGLYVVLAVTTYFEGALWRATLNGALAVAMLYVYIRKRKAATG